MTSKRQFHDLDITPGREDLPDGSESVAVSVRTEGGQRHALLLPTAAERLLKRNPEARDYLQALQDCARAIAEERALLDRLVPQCRAQGVSWDTIGWYLGITGSAVRQRWTDETPRSAR